MLDLKFAIKKILPTTYHSLHTNNEGFIALVTFSIIFIVALIVGLSSNLLSVSEATMGLEKIQSSQAYYLANLCAEKALIELKEDTDYPGNETIAIEGGYCQILPIEGDWTIKILASFQEQVKKIKIVVSQVHPKMTIESWQQVSEL